MPDALTSELDAVNTCLGSIGEAPVSSLTGTLPQDVTVARAILTRERRSVLSKGWNFNSEREVTVALNGSGYAVIPTTTLKVELTYADSSIDVVQRGIRLYDKKNHTYVFTKTLKMDFVYLLSWDDLPEQARAYLAMKAARIFQASTMGAPELDGYTSRDEALALITFKEADGDSRNSNIFDSYDMQKFYRYRRRY